MIKAEIQETGSSRFITTLITKDGKKNNIALRSEITAGLDIFKQWWRYEPYEPKQPGRNHRQTEITRQSDLGYPVLCGRASGIRRYWRFRSIVRTANSVSPLELAYRSALIKQANGVLVAMLNPLQPCLLVAQQVESMLSTMASPDGN